MRAPHAPVVCTFFLFFLRFFSNHKNSNHKNVCIFPHTSQFCSIYNEKMSDNSSCSSDSNTFEMYQDFNIIFDDPIPRRDQWDHTRIDWDAHVEKLCHEKHFKREYQISLEAFNKLVFILSPSLQRNNMYSHSSTPISPIIIVSIGIWYLAGGELSNIRHVFGVSAAEACNFIECFIERTLHCDSMRITLPQNPEEWDAIHVIWICQSVTR